MTNETQINHALDTMNRLKEATKNNEYFNSEFTNITVNNEGYCQIERDWYEVYKHAAMEISKKYNIFPEDVSQWNESDWGPVASYGQSITDDDTIADWLARYDGNLGQLQTDYPGIELHEINELFTWNTMCQQRAFSPMPMIFTNTQIYK